MTIRYVVDAAVWRRVLSTPSKLKAEKLVKQYATFTQAQWLRVDDKKRYVTRLPIPEPEPKRKR